VGISDAQNMVETAMLKNSEGANVSAAGGGSGVDGKHGVAPTVSVIIPTYNRADCIVAAVESVLAQTFRDLEIIVVDDGSTDDTVRRLAAYGPPVRVVTKPNGGVASARNVGLRLARGRYVAWLDSDDLWLPFKLDLQLRVFREFPEVKLVFSEFNGLDESGRVSARFAGDLFHSLRLHKGGLRGVFPGHGRLTYALEGIDAAPAAIAVHYGRVYEKLIWGNLMLPTTIMFERSLVGAAGDFDESLRIFEDYDFHLRLARIAPVAYVDVPTAVYRHARPDRLTYDDDLDLLIEQARLQLRLIQNIARRDQDVARREPRWQAWCSGRVHAHLASLLGPRDRPAARAHWQNALRMNPRAALSPRTLARVLLPTPVVRLVRQVKAVFLAQTRRG
jgi:glycosyltransferase involved in cell wall biosynthesis